MCKMSTLRLREILKERHITIGQLSEMSGISQSNLSNYMTGKMSPTLDTLNRIALALNIEITELFEKEEDIVLFVKYRNRMVELSRKELINYLRNKTQNNEN